MRSHASSNSGCVGAVRAAALACGFALLAGHPAIAQELDLDDLENRADYAYFTADAKSLRTLIREAQSASSKGSADKMTRYVLGFAQYRLGQLLAKSQGSEAAKAMDACASARLSSRSSALVAAASALGITSAGARTPYWDSRLYASAIPA